MMAAHHPLADSAGRALDWLLVAPPSSPEHDQARDQLRACLIQLGTIEHGYAELVANEIEQDRLDGTYTGPDAGRVFTLPELPA